MVDIWPTSLTGKRGLVLTGGGGFNGFVVAEELDSAAKNFQRSVDFVQFNHLQ